MQNTTFTRQLAMEFIHKADADLDAFTLSAVSIGDLDRVLNLLKDIRPRDLRNELLPALAQVRIEMVEFFEQQIREGHSFGNALIRCRDEHYSKYKRLVLPDSGVAR